MEFEDVFREARKRDEYWVEDAVLSFTTQLYGLLKKRGLSQADLAERLGVSQPYVARILKGKDNLTIATMVKLARAIRGRLQISVPDEDAGLEARVADARAEQPLVLESQPGKKPIS